MAFGIFSNSLGGFVCCDSIDRVANVIGLLHRRVSFIRDTYIMRTVRITVPLLPSQYGVRNTPPKILV